MMKLKDYMWLCLAFIALLLLGCSGQEAIEDVDGGKQEQTPTSPTTWHFRYAMDGEEEGSRVADFDLQVKALDGHARLGLTCLSREDQSVLFQNRKFKTGDDKTLVPDDGEDMPEKPSVPFLLYALAPYDVARQDLSPFVFEVQTDQCSEENYIASDLLRGCTSQMDEDGTVDLTLGRQLTRWMLDVKIANGLKPSDFDGASFAIYRVKTAITYDPMRGMVGEPQGKNGIIEFLKLPDEVVDTEFKGMVIIPPQTFTEQSRCYLRVTFKDGVKRYFTFDPFVFKGRFNYTSRITLNGYGHNLTATIQPFEEETHWGLLEEQ